MDVLINKMWGILLQHIHISYHHDVHFEYLIILCIHDSSLKLKLKTTIKKNPKIGIG